MQSKLSAKVNHEAVVSTLSQEKKRVFSTRVRVKDKDKMQN